MGIGLGEDMFSALRVSNISGGAEVARRLADASEDMRVPSSVTVHHKDWTGLFAVLVPETSDWQPGQPRTLGLIQCVEHPSASAIALGGRVTGAKPASGDGFVGPFMGSAAMLKKVDSNLMLPPDSLELLDSGMSRRGGEPPPTLSAREIYVHLVARHICRPASALTHLIPPFHRHHLSGQARMAMSGYYITRNGSPDHVPLTPAQLALVEHAKSTEEAKTLLLADPEFNPATMELHAQAASDIGELLWF